MKKQFLQLPLFISFLLVLAACQKELSVEGTGLGGNAQGTLTDTSGTCKGAVVKGEYVVDRQLTDSNYVILKVNFTLQGKYKIFTDTVNGMWFMDSGFALTTGANTVKLKGKGKPILPNIADFIVTFNSSYCAFAVTTLSSSGGGGTGGDYFPTTTGSNWTYEYIPKLGSVDTFRTTVTTKKVTYNTREYIEFSTDPLNEPYYFSKDNAGNYYAYSTVDFDYLFVFDSIPNGFIDYLFLKDYAPVGDTWESGEYGKVKLGNEVGVSKAVFSIAGKNISYTVLGSSFQNVINVKREIWFKPDGGTYRKIIEGNSYYAKGVGMIDQVVPTSSTASQSVSMRRKEIK